MKSRLKTLMPRSTDLQFFFEMAFYGEKNLSAPDVIFHATAFFAQAHDLAIGEADVFIIRLGVDLGNLVTVFVGGAFVGKMMQIGALFGCDSFLAGSVFGLLLNADFGFETRSVINLLDAYKGVVGAAIGQSGGNHYLFDQFQFKGANRVELVDQVVGVG